MLQFLATEALPHTTHKGILAYCFGENVKSL